MRSCFFLALFALLGSACTTSHPAGDGGLDAGALGTCAGPTDCVVVPESCCGTCGQPTRGDAVALNVSSLGTYRSAVCAGMACPACAGRPDPTLAATCTSGACAVVDLQARALTACTADSDCRVRAAACCECGATIAPGTVVAIRTDSESAYAALACDPGSACPDCLPSYAGWTASCASGRCVALAPATP